MRTREELERALLHMDHAMIGAALSSDGDYAAERLGPLIDLLHWVLKQPSQFEKTIRSCEDLAKQIQRQGSDAPWN